VTSIDNFPIDFIGFLILQRRNHEFLYWSKGNIDDTSLQEICKNVIIDFNAEASTRIHEQRVAIRRMPLQSAINGNVKGPLKFKYMIPVCLDNLKFGAVLFGSFKDIKNENEKKTMLSSLVSQTRIALANSKLYSDMKENYIRTIKALAIAVDAKDTYTHGHSENVMNIAEEIAREMGIDEKGIGIIRDAGLLHDIGKIGIPGYILNKPGPLTYEEFNGIMKTHSTLGANIVKDVPFLRDLHKLILYHHEHFDGGGYPDNLKGEQIPVGARILHVADAFEAMTSNRPYRNSLGKSEAFRRLTECSGKQFDPEVIDAFLRLAKKKGWIEEMNV
jgi:putative nucleotidyltransferase with HDIG domain